MSLSTAPAQCRRANDAEHSALRAFSIIVGASMKPRLRLLGIFLRVVPARDLASDAFSRNRATNRRRLRRACRNFSASIGREKYSWSTLRELAASTPVLVAPP